MDAPPDSIEGAAPTTTPADLETTPRPGQWEVTPRAVTTDSPPTIPVADLPRRLKTKISNLLSRTLATSRLASRDNAAVPDNGGYDSNGEEDLKGAQPFGRQLSSRLSHSADKMRSSDVVNARNSLTEDTGGLEIWPSTTGLESGSSAVTGRVLPINISVIAFRINLPLSLPSIHIPG